MPISSSTSMFGLSLLAIPITYCVNIATIFNGERGLLVAGVSALVGMCVLTYLVLGRKGVPPDPLFYVFSILTFSSVVDLIIALENDGVIQGFMSEYLRNGEPYLKTAYGTMICYWDGIGHYAMYLMMLAAQAWGQSYREVGLYWVGSIGHSMIVLVFGSFVGKYGVRPSFLLNVPFMFIPFLGGVKFLNERKNTPISSEQVKQEHKCILKRPVDLLFVIYFLASIAVAVIRGFSVLGADQEPMKSYMTYYEPYLSDPVAYPKIQMLVYLFHYLPFYSVAVFALVFPGCQWLPDWALIHAGAAVQAQIPHIGASLHYRTPYVLRVPMATDVRAVFWTINFVLLLIIPQLFAYRCLGWPQFFQRTRRDSLKIQKSE